MSPDYWRVCIPCSLDIDVPAPDSDYMSTATTGWVPEDDFAARLLLARKQSGLTVREASMRCGVHYATWSTWERGSVPANMADIVRAISEGLGCDRAWLAWGGQLAPATAGRKAGTARGVASAQTRRPTVSVTLRAITGGRRRTDQTRRTRDALPRPVLALVS